MNRATIPALRVVTAGLIGAIAAIHLDLWADHGYRHIPTIGALFLLNGIAGSILAVACLAARRRLIALTAVASGLFAVGTLGALITSVNVGLFGFTETATAPLFDQAIAVEAAAMAAAALLGVKSHSHRPRISRRFGQTG